MVPMMQRPVGPGFTQLVPPGQSSSLAQEQKPTSWFSPDGLQPRPSPHSALPEPTVHRCSVTTPSSLQS